MQGAETAPNHDKAAAAPALGGPPGVGGPPSGGPGGAASGAELSKLYKEMDDKVRTAKIPPSGERAALRAFNMNRDASSTEGVAKNKAVRRREITIMTQ